MFNFVEIAKCVHSYMQNGKLRRNRVNKVVSGNSSSHIISTWKCWYCNIVSAREKKNTHRHTWTICMHALFRPSSNPYIFLYIFAVSVGISFFRFEHAYINLVARCWNLYTYSQLQSRCPFRIHIIFQVFPFLALIRVFFKHALMWDAWYKDWAWISVARCDIYTPYAKWCEIDGVHKRLMNKNTVS